MNEASMAGCLLWILIAVPIEIKISRGTDVSESEVRPNLFCFIGDVFFHSCTKDFSQDLIKGARIKLKEKSDVK